MPTQKNENSEPQMRDKHGHLLISVVCRKRKSLSSNSDQHQISPCNINVYSTPEVMRIEGMIT